MLFGAAGSAMQAIAIIDRCNGGNCYKPGGHSLLEQRCVVPVDAGCRKHKLIKLPIYNCPETQ